MFRKSKNKYANELGSLVNSLLHTSMSSCLIFINEMFTKIFTTNFINSLGRHLFCKVVKIMSKSNETVKYKYFLHGGSKSKFI